MSIPPCVRMLGRYAVLGALFLGAPVVSSSAQELARRSLDDRPNIVLVVLDDMGVDKVGAYMEGPVGLAPPCTPNLDSLAAGGVLFRNVWTNPVCSPSRAQLLTGLHAFRNGVGMGVPPDGSQLGLDAQAHAMLPRVLTNYDTSAVGKWHLMSPQNGDENQPFEAGFDYYAGSLYNLFERFPGDPTCERRGALGYYNWVKTYGLDGKGVLQRECTSEYATTDTTDEAIFRARSMEPPWFLYVSYNSAHDPTEQPPYELCPPIGTCGLQYCQEPSADYDHQVNGMVEALDTELGRLLRAIEEVDPDAYVFVIGDNGSVSRTELPPEGGCFGPDHDKATVFEGGVNVPLLVSGPDVVPGECAALVNSTDVYNTITELASVAARAEDSVSLVPYLRGDHHPRRETVFAELFTPNQWSATYGLGFRPRLYLRTMRDERVKLIRFTGAGFEVERFYDLTNDPCELSSFCSGLQPCDPDALPVELRERYFQLRKRMTAMGAY